MRRRIRVDTVDWCVCVCEERRMNICMGEEKLVSACDINLVRLKYFINITMYCISSLSLSSSFIPPSPVVCSH